MKKMFIVGALILLVVIILIMVLSELLKQPPYAAYNDGVYIGEAQGYRKHLKVQLTLSGGYITDVQVIEHYEKGEEHYKEPVEKIPEAIIKTQSTEVDAISGATLTSNGIMDAASAALAQAK